MIDQESELQVSIILRRAIRKWPVVTGLAIFGALAGFLISLLQSPQFQAEAMLAININYGVTEPLELVVEDRSLHRVETILESDDTFEIVFEDLPESLKAERKWKKPSDLGQAIHVERRLSEWALVAIDRDPQVATTLAELWAKVALLVLDEASEHAWRALALMADNPLEVGCVPVSKLEGDTEIIDWVCCVQPEDLASDTLSDELKKEITLSRGMLPNISYELIREAQPPADPVIWARGSLVLSGGLIGLIFGFWWVLIRRD
jgi:hypothetical protein